MHPYRRRYRQRVRNRQRGRPGASGYFASALSAPGLVRQGYKYASQAYKAYKTAKPYVKKALNKYYSKPPAQVALRTKNPVKKKLAKIQKQLNNNTGTYIYKRLVSDRVLASVNQCNYINIIRNSVTDLEAVIDGLQYFNPSVPGTLTTVDATSGTYHKEVEINSTFSRLECRNNYQSPCIVDIYCVTPKQDTGIAVSTAVTNGFSDVGSGLGINSILMYPSDSPQFNDLYKIVSHVRKELNPGQSCKSTFTGGSFQYDPSYVDSHALANQKIYNNHQYLIRVQGIVGHDTALDEQGILAAGVDVTCYDVIKVLYPAGIDIVRYEHVLDLDTFTNSGVFTSKPVADNIGYAVS